MNSAINISRIEGKEAGVEVFWAHPAPPAGVGSSSAVSDGVVGMKRTSPVPPTSGGGEAGGVDPAVGVAELGSSNRSRTPPSSIQA